MKIARMGLFACAVSTLSLVAAVGPSGVVYAAPQCDEEAVAVAREAIDDACPCEGRTNGNGEVVPWRNHGQYVACVAVQRNHLAKDLELSKSCLRRVVRCGARSNCGKPDFVTCRIPDECSDPLADGTAEGTCADAPEIACDTAADCPILKCSVKSSAERCEERGGIVGTGSCCD